MATSGTYYIDTADFSTATAVWTNTALTTKAPDGYYSFGGNYRQQFEGLLLPISSCGSAPTTIPISAIAITSNTTVTATCSDSNTDPIEGYIYVRMDSDWFILQGGVNKVKNDLALLDTEIIERSDPMYSVHPNSYYDGSIYISPGTGFEGTVMISNNTSQSGSKILLNSDGYFVSSSACEPPVSCTSYTVSTTSGTGQSYTYTACDGTPSGGNIGGAGGYDADTFCAQTGTVELLGSELTLTTNSSCTE